MKNAKRFFLLLLYLRLISFESDRGSGSARHGWLFARPTSVIILKMPQASEGLNSRKKTFGYFFVFLKVTPPEGHVAFGLFKNEDPRQVCRLNGIPLCSSVSVRMAVQLSHPRPEDS